MPQRVITKGKKVLRFDMNGSAGNSTVPSTSEVLRWVNEV